MSTDSSRQHEFEAQAMPLVDQLYAGALRMTRRPEAAEDLVQDALLRAWRFYDRFEPGTNFRAWIFRIMTNVFINQYRKAAKEPQQTDLESIDGMYNQMVREYQQSLEHNPEHQMLQKVEAGVVRLAIDELPEVFRLPVILCDLQGFAYKEIAAILDVPVGTVMSRLYRGRKQLSTGLLQYAQEHGYVPGGSTV